MAGHKWYVEAESSQNQWKYTHDFRDDRKAARSSVAELVRKWTVMYDRDDISITEGDALLFTNLDLLPYKATVKEYFNCATGDRVQLWEVDTGPYPANYTLGDKGNIIPIENLV